MQAAQQLTRLLTGNHAAGHSLSVAAEANRNGRGAVCGIYPITPQTEIVEYVANFPFSKARVVPVESEHSAMGVCIGASMSGARSFTASSSNGLAYMAENIMVAAFYRLPIVMAAVNRTLGPPWNIWADQGDTLMFRDFGWIQFYCDSNQDVSDTTLLAFRLAEDSRILLPVMVCMDAFIVSHTAMETLPASQQQADRFLPVCRIPHRMNHDQPVTVGGLTWPNETMSQRAELDEAMQRVPSVLKEHLDEFSKVFGRELAGPVVSLHAADADHLIVVSGSMATTAREVVKKVRKNGRKIGMVQIRMFRPFPVDEIRKHCANARKIGVLDRNYSAGSGGIFCQDLKSCLQGHSDALVQGYLAGVGGGDVVPAMVEDAIADLYHREAPGAPLWMGLEP